MKTKGISDITLSRLFAGLISSTTSHFPKFSGLIKFPIPLSKDLFFSPVKFVFRGNVPYSTMETLLSGRPTQHFQRIPFSPLSRISRSSCMLINPTNPTNPINSSNPINPINPTNPINSTNPINPINPTNPTNSINSWSCPYEIGHPSNLFCIILCSLGDLILSPLWG